MTSLQIFKNTLIVLLTLAAAYVLFMSADIIIVLLLAIIIASAIRPWVMSLNRRGIPVGVAILGIYLGLAIMVILIGVIVLPPVVNQISQYLENDARLAYRIIRAQHWVEGVISDVTQDEVSLVAPDDVRAAVSDFVMQFNNAMPSVLDNIGSTLGQAVLIFVMGAYWLTSHTKAIEFMVRLSPPRARDKTQQVIDEIEVTMGAYVRGIGLVSAIVGLLNLVGMQVLGVPNALTLAFIIAVTTAIPMIGGALGLVIAALLTLVATPEHVVAVIAVAFIVQQIEAYYLSPRIMSGSVGVDPLLVIVYTAIGFIIFGIVGALIAVPIMGTIHIILLRLVLEPYQEGMSEFHTEEGLPLIRSNKDTHDHRPQPAPHDVSL